MVQEAKEKHSNIYLNFCYTDYGGSFLNKVIISYFKEYYTEKQCLMIAEATQEYINDNELSDDLYDIVRDWFFDNGYLEPNYIDYSEHDLNEYIKHYTL